MKNILGIAAAVITVTFVSPAFSQQGGVISFFDKETGLCYIEATITGFREVYVVHIDVAEASGAEFSVDWTSAVGASYLFQQVLLGQSIGTLANGDGFSVLYGSCQAGPAIIFAVLGLGGGWAPCSYIEAIKHVISGFLVGVDCADVVHGASGSRLILGGNEEQCGPVCAGHTCCTLVPVQEKTWGAIKSLYQ